MPTDTLIVIPVRAGSTGVPNKALRSLHGLSCLERAIRTAQQVHAEIVVTTNDEQVRARAQQQERVLAWLQPEAISQPQAALDAAVAFATTITEQTYRPENPYRIVVTLQCTSPFTRPETVTRAIQCAREYETCVTVRDDRGLRWHAPANDGILTSRAPARVTRQQMPPEWRETGAVFATQRRHVTPEWRFGPTCWLLPVTGREALDIDTPEDWALAEWYAGPLTREALLARVLAGSPVPAMPTVVFSAYREVWDEQRARHLHAISRGGEIHYLYGEHTRHEAELALEWYQASAMDICLVTSAYHQLRAFLTTLKVAQERGWTGRLWNAPAPSSMEKLGQEYEKIARYQAKGDCASYEDGLAYLENVTIHA